MGKQRKSGRGILILIAGIILIAVSTGTVPAVRHAVTNAITAAKAAAGKVPVASASEAAFFRAVLTDMSAPKTSGNLASLESWYPHEWPSWPPGAQYNPLDSTLVTPGSWTFNSFPCGNGGTCHVENYPTRAEGAQATAQTLLNGYPGIVADLRSGKGFCGDTSLAAEFLTWSGDGYSGVC